MDKSRNRTVWERLSSPTYPKIIHTKVDRVDDRLKVYVPKMPDTISASIAGGSFNAETVDRWPPGADTKIVMMNKASNVTPEKQDASQRTSIIMPVDQYQNLLLEQYGFDPGEVINKTQRLETLAALQRALSSFQNAEHFTVVSKMENSSQCNNANTTQTNGTTTDLLWSDNCCNTAEMTKKYEDKLDVKDVEICSKPRMKVIAEMYTRYKKNNIELRRLEDRVVCLEYDVHAKENSAKPERIMRAYFFVKIGCDICKNNELKEVPSEVKDSLHIGEEEFIHNSHREVEIIDDKIPENKPYLKDLWRLMQRRRAIKTKQNKSSLDLKSMYIMACNDMPARDHDFSTTNILSKAELNEVKELILKNCESRVNNLIRKKLMYNENNDSDEKRSIKSESMFYAALHPDFKE